MFKLQVLYLKIIHKVCAYRLIVNNIFFNMKFDLHIKNFRNPLVPKGTKLELYGN